jgi:hypothetical protein
LEILVEFSDFFVLWEKLPNSATPVALKKLGLLRIFKIFEAAGFFFDVLRRLSKIYGIFEC